MEIAYHVIRVMLFHQLTNVFNLQNKTIKILYVLDGRTKYVCNVPLDPFSMG